MQLLRAVDDRDLDAVMDLFAPDGHLLTVDGQRVHGADAARNVLKALLTELRSCVHRITEQWHVDGVWIAEVDASYELQDWLALKDLPRVFVARMSGEQISDLRVYGAHELPLTEHRTGEEGMWIGTRWIPPL